jgi:hypothetical protein
MANHNLYNGNLSILPVGPSVLTSEEFDVGGETTAATYDLFKIPAGSVVLGCIVEITENAGESCSCSVGITGTSTGAFAEGVNLSQAAGTLVAGGGSYITTPTFLTASTEVTLLTTTGTTYAAGKGRVHLLVAKA